MSQPEIWQMCLEVVSESARRVPSNVRPHVNRIAKRRFFDLDEHIEAIQRALEGE